MEFCARYGQVDPEKQISTEHCSLAQQKSKVAMLTDQELAKLQKLEELLEPHRYFFLVSCVCVHVYCTDKKVVSVFLCVINKNLLICLKHLVLSIADM